MRKIRVLLLLIFIYANCFAQNTIKITYKNIFVISKETLNSLPKEIQETALKQMQNSFSTSYLFIQGDDVFYLSKQEEKETLQKG